MAFTVRFQDPFTGHPRYNFDQTVRKGSRGVDVQLLQVLLNMLYFDLSERTGPMGFVTEVPRLVEDGIDGPQTRELAGHCRSIFIESGINLVNLNEHPEGRGLDPMRQPGEASTRLKVTYFIDSLNRIVSNFDAALGLNRYAFLAFDDQVPLALRNALKTVKTTALKYQFGG